MQVQAYASGCLTDLVLVILSLEGIYIEHNPTDKYERATGGNKFENGNRHKSPCLVVVLLVANVKRSIIVRTIWSLLQV